MCICLVNSDSGSSECGEDVTHRQRCRDTPPGRAAVPDPVQRMCVRRLPRITRMAAFVADVDHADSLQRCQRTARTTVLVGVAARSCDIDENVQPLPAVTRVRGRRRRPVRDVLTVRVVEVTAPRGIGPSRPPSRHGPLHEGSDDPAFAGGPSRRLRCAPRIASMCHAQPPARQQRGPSSRPRVNRRNGTLGPFSPPRHLRSFIVVAGRRCDG